MKAKKEAGKKIKAHTGAAQVRATISFPPQVYEILESFAKQKKVSLAWVVREAVDKHRHPEWSPAIREAWNLCQHFLPGGLCAPLFFWLACGA
jgi:hypothetical protein